MENINYKEENNNNEENKNIEEENKNNENNNNIEEKPNKENKNELEEKNNIEENINSIENNNNNKEEINNNNKKENNNYNDEEYKNINIEEENKKIENILIESIQRKENPTKEKLEQAEKINFLSAPDSIIKTNQYGEIKKENINNEEENLKEKEDLLQLNARLEKWNYMINNYEKFTNKEYRKLKSRTRKGIPDSLRGFIWQKFAEIKNFYVPNLYESLEKEKLDEDIEMTILKDLDRTFPNILLFMQKYGKGQRLLYYVLSRFTKYNKDTGYVQGIGFIAGLFLTYMDEESTFFMLISLMKNKKYDLEGFYLTGFPSLHQSFYVLLNLQKKFIPNIYYILKNNNILPSMYAGEWFLTLFTRELDFKILVRIFDTYLLEGLKVIYRFSIGFMKLKEDDFIKYKEKGMIKLMEVIKNLLKNVNVEELFKISFKLKLSRKDIKKYENNYLINKNNKKNDEFMQMLI